MIRLGFCPNCQKITTQNIVKSLRSVITTCRICNQTLHVEHPARKPLQSVKPRKFLRKMSAKMTVQKRGEKKLEQKLLELCHNRCEICGSSGIVGVAKHEIVKRSQQGNECDPLNCLILCTSGCHNHAKYPKTGTPLSIKEQQDLAKKLHSGVK